MTQSSDIHFMRHALLLAERGLGRTWPNPSVGALVVKDGNVLGAATTERGGRPHAETQALQQAGEKAKGATLYVTLEPCAHVGKTPPCAKAIIEAGIARVVIACADPNPKAKGGAAALRNAGIEIVQGVCEKEALAVNEGFLSVIERGRPFVTLKIATSLDGKIASANGESKWITGEDSRRKVHMLRATHDAVLTGIGTVLYDDPLLTCRLPGREEDSPQRIIMDSSLRISEDARILPAWVITGGGVPEKAKAKAKALASKGATIIPVSLDAAKLSLTETLGLLAERGITRLLVEAGSALASEFLRLQLIDRLYWFRAPFIIGDRGIPALQVGNDAPLADLPRFSLLGTERFGPDILEIYDIPSSNG